MTETESRIFTTTARLFGIKNRRIGIMTESGMSVRIMIKTELRIQRITALKFTTRNRKTGTGIESVMPVRITMKTNGLTAKMRVRSM